MGSNWSATGETVISESSFLTGEGYSAYLLFARCKAHSVTSCSVSWSPVVLFSDAVNQRFF